MSFLIPLSKDNTELLEKLPEEMRTMLMAYINHLDEKISSLLITAAEDFENRYVQIIMDLFIAS
jgi:hypothetical protein